MADERDWEVRIIKNYLVPLLDKRKEWDEDVDEEHVEEAGWALAEAYWEEGKGFHIRFLKIFIPLIIIDVLFVFPPQIYGLVFSTTGSWILLVEGNFQDRYAIASRSLTTLGNPLEPAQKRRLAHQSVIANLGLVWMTLGFLLQLIVLILFPEGNAITTDYYTNSFP